MCLDAKTPDIGTSLVSMVGAAVLSGSVFDKLVVVSSTRKKIRPLEKKQKLSQVYILDLLSLVAIVVVVVVVVVGLEGCSRDFCEC